jgi:outer membrane protein assembly factor BamB
MPGRLLSLVFGLALAPAAWALADWPQWRGPDRDAVSPETGLLDRWDEAPPLVWKAEGVGGGYAGAVVQKGLVCTIGERDGKVFVSGVRDEDGKLLWTTEVVERDVDKARDRSYTASTPTMDGERVYALTKGGFLACLKTATGEPVWQKSYKHDFGGVRPWFSYCESPLVDGDRLICTPCGKDATVLALDKKTGAELWRCKATFKDTSGYGSCYASPVVSRGAGVKQYVQFVGEGVIGVDAETGKELWHYTGVAGASNICTPVVRGDHVYVPCGYYTGSALLKLEPTGDGGVRARQVYFADIRKLRTESGGAVLVGDYLYQSHIGTGSPECVEFLTGKMMWDRQRGPGSGSAAVAYADGHVYFRYANGVVLLVAATPEKYQLKGRFKTPGGDDCWAHPAISNGRLYLRNGDAIYCYDLKKR